MADPYYRYYVNPYHPQWAALRRTVLLRDRGQCQHCGSRQNLQVHHLTYARLGQERLEDLLTLCSACHTQLHQHPLNRRKNPMTDNSSTSNEVLNIDNLAVTNVKIKGAELTATLVGVTNATDVGQLQRHHWIGALEDWRNRLLHEVFD